MGIYFFELLVIVILLIVLWNRGRGGIDTLLIRFGAAKRRSMDVSGQEIPVPPELKYTIEALAKLGFKRLGEVQVELPGKRTSFSRLFVSKDQKVFVDLAESRILLFTSVFKDDAVVETGFPVGENISGKNFQSHTVTTGMEPALRHQRAQLEAFGKTHGPVRKIKTIPDYQVWEAMYRRRYITRKMLRHTILGFFQLSLLGYGISALLAAVVYWLGSDKATVDPLIFITTVLVGALTPAAILAFLSPFFGDWGSRRNARE
jgi:hypothetical protein